MITQSEQAQVPQWDGWESFPKVCQLMQLKWTYMALNILFEYLFLNRLSVFFTYIFQDISGVLWKQNWSQSIVIVLS